MKTRKLSTYGGGGGLQVWFPEDRLHPWTPLPALMSNIQTCIMCDYLLDWRHS